MPLLLFFVLAGAILLVIAGFLPYRALATLPPRERADERLRRTTAVTFAMFIVTIALGVLNETGAGIAFVVLGSGLVAARVAIRRRYPAV